MNAKSHSNPAPQPDSSLQDDSNGLTQEVLERIEPFVLPDRAEEAAQVVSLMIQQSHSGPLPSARELAGYDRALPGAAERIVVMAEREQAHRHSLEGKVVDAEAKMRGRGQWLAIFALIVMLCVVALFAFWGHAAAGATLGSAVVVGVVALFLGTKIIPQPRKQDPPSPGS